MITMTETPANFRKGFSMITAIFVIVLMSGVAAMVFSLSAKTTKETTAQYQREQAILLARSYTEYAIMAVSARDINTTSCLRNVRGRTDTYNHIKQGMGYDILINIYYIGDGFTGGGGSGAGQCPNSRILYSNKSTRDRNSTLDIIVDTYVKYRDIDLVDLYMRNHGGAVPNANALPWTTYHKRTLQKI